MRTLLKSHCVLWTGSLHLGTSGYKMYQAAALLDPLGPNPQLLPLSCISQTHVHSGTWKGWALLRPSPDSLARPPSSWSGWQPISANEQEAEGQLATRALLAAWASRFLAWQ